jgi:hypothetical protein
MLLMTMFDLQQRPYEGWLPLLTMQGELVGRVAVQMFGDWTERIIIGVMRGTVGVDADALGKGDPYVQLKVREEKQKTEAKKDARNPVWDENFKFLIGSRDKLQISVYDSDVVSYDDKYGSAEVLGIDILKRKGEAMWVPIVNSARHESCKVLIQIEADQWAQILPVRILQAKGMAPGDLGSSSDMYIVGKCGSQSFQTSTKNNSSEAIWDEEFVLEIRQFDALHLSVKDKDILWDESLGEAFIPANELLAHIGEQVWVDLTGTNGKHNGKLLLWIQPPPGSVYPDTLSRKRLIAYESWDKLQPSVPKLGYNYRPAQARAPSVSGPVYQRAPALTPPPVAGSRYVGETRYVSPTKTRYVSPSRQRMGYAPAPSYPTYRYA